MATMMLASLCRQRITCFVHACQTWSFWRSVVCKKAKREYLSRPQFHWTKASSSVHEQSPTVSPFVSSEHLPLLQWVFWWFAQKVLLFPDFNSQTKIWNEPPPGLLFLITIAEQDWLDSFDYDIRNIMILIRRCSLWRDLVPTCNLKFLELCRGHETVPDFTGAYLHPAQVLHHMQYTGTKRWRWP